MSELPSSDDLLAGTGELLADLIRSARSGNSATGKDEGSGAHSEEWSIADKLKLADTVTKFVGLRQKLSVGDEAPSGLSVLRNKFAGGRKAAG